MNYNRVQVQDETNYTIKGEITWKQENSTEYDVC